MILFRHPKFCLLSSPSCSAMLSCDGISLPLSSRDVGKQDCCAEGTLTYIARPFLCVQNKKRSHGWICLKSMWEGRDPASMLPGPDCRPWLFCLSPLLRSRLPRSAQPCRSPAGQPGITAPGNSQGRRSCEYRWGSFTSPIFSGTAFVTRSSALVFGWATAQPAPTLVPADHHLLLHRCGLAGQLQRHGLALVTAPVPSLLLCWALLDGPWPGRAWPCWPHGHPQFLARFRGAAICCSTLLCAEVYHQST